MDDITNEFHAYETITPNRKALNELITIATLRHIVEDREIFEEEKQEFNELINFQYN